MLHHNNDAMGQNRPSKRLAQQFRVRPSTEWKDRLRPAPTRHFSYFG